MSKQNGINTKEEILKAAARLFSEKGYDCVTTREIAKDIGINSASIYYHFPSKKDILQSLYRFYSVRHYKERPDLDELLRLAETAPPHEVLMKSEYHYNEELRGMFDQILVAAARRFGADPESERFIRENIFENISTMLRPLLYRLLELKKVKPFDVETFLKVLSYYCFSAASLNRSPFGQGVAEYQAGMSFLFSMITPIGE